jgi:hypothetical protein
MSSPRFDLFETYAQEHGSRLLKASDDASLLRSLSKKSEPEAGKQSSRAFRPRLVSILASLILIRTSRHDQSPGQIDFHRTNQPDIFSSSRDQRQITIWR